MLSAVVTLALAAATAHPAAARPCHAVVDRGVLPAWARTGFSDPRPRMPHTVGRHRLLAAIIFGDPLRSPPPPHYNNKILWVSRPAWTPQVRNLRLRAQRMRGTRRLGRPVTRIVPGAPGPSIIDLPAAGCWRINASWGPHRDQLDLYYQRR
jgi:hypothetical protein